MCSGVMVNMTLPVKKVVSSIPAGGTFNMQLKQWLLERWWIIPRQDNNT
jgi:hypothetical protein